MSWEAMAPLVRAGKVRPDATLTPFGPGRRSLRLSIAAAKLPAPWLADGVKLSAYLGTGSDAGLLRIDAEGIRPFKLRKAKRGDRCSLALPWPKGAAPGDFPRTPCEVSAPGGG